jgi:glycosyltransferase involved in cell wall biosynthesis
LITPKKSGELSEVVCRLLGNDVERYNLGKEAKKRFYQHFSVQSMVSNYEALYREILRRKGIVTDNVQ